MKLSDMWSFLLSICILLSTIAVAGEPEDTDIATGFYFYDVDSGQVFVGLDAIDDVRDTMRVSAHFESAPPYIFERYSRILTTFFPMYDGEQYAFGNPYMLKLEVADQCYTVPMAISARYITDIGWGYYKKSNMFYSVPVDGSEFGFNTNYHEDSETLGDVASFLFTMFAVDSVTSPGLCIDSWHLPDSIYRPVHVEVEYLEGNTLESVGSQTHTFTNPNGHYGLFAVAWDPEPAISNPTAQHIFGDTVPEGPDRVTVTLQGYKPVVIDFDCQKGRITRRNLGVVPDYSIGHEPLRVHLPKSQSLHTPQLSR